MIQLYHGTDYSLHVIMYYVATWYTTVRCFALTVGEVASHEFIIRYSTYS